MKPWIIFLTGLLIATFSFAQNPEHLIDYTWEENRTINQLPDSLGELPAIVLKEFVAHEYYYHGIDKSLHQYTINHRIIRVNSDAGIASYNRIYVPFDSEDKLEELAARSISPTGKVKILVEEDFKELTDEQSDDGYRIFAIEGLEIGSEVEYYYKQKKPADYFGREYFQRKIPTLNASFTLYCPANLRFSFKSYNRFPEIEENFDAEKRNYRVQAAYLPELDEERYAFFNPNRARLDFKLSYNEFAGSSRLLTWSDAASRIYESLYVVTEKELEDIQSFYETFNFKKKENARTKAVAIENKLKSEFFIRNISDEQFSDISAILANKIGNHNGIVRLYLSLLKLARIENEVVVTTKRDNVKFDPEFDSWNYLISYVIYLPELDTYLAPLEQEYRLGMVPFQYTENYGLFVQEVNVGESLKGIGEIRFIPSLEYTKSEDYLDLFAEFSDDLQSISMTVIREISGYNAVYIQPYYAFLDEENKEEVMENYIRSTTSEAEILSMEVSNGEWNLSPLDKPFTVKSELKSSNLIEKAGDKILLKLGEMIGPQTELYRDEERSLGVENDFNRNYRRIIRLNIPEGYKIRNPDDILLSVTHEQKGEKVFGFESDYRIDKNVLTTEINEYYKIISCPMECYEPFRQVINAAADFNKVVLVLEKTDN
jgi:hypothetical protein